MSTLPLLAQSSVRRRRQNSWWKCRRCCLFLRSCSSLLSSRSLTFQFCVVGFQAVEVFKVFSKDRKQRPFSDRSLTFEFSVVPHMILLILARQLHPQYRVMRLDKGFFRTFPRGKKSPKSAASPSARVHGHPSSWTPALMARVLWLTTMTRASSWTMLATCEPRPQSIAWVDSLGQSWLHVRRHDAENWWNLDIQHTQWQPPWER